MEIGGQIHWFEGLFLQPHHIQFMQKTIFDKFERERRLFWNYPYGLIEAKISDEELENLRVRFDRLRVLMPSGLEVSVPDNADLPSLDIKEAFASSSGPLAVMLGVPLWYGARGNVIEGGTGEGQGTKYMYRTAEIERPDENTGENPQTILIRRINARLLLDSDDRSDLDVLPLLKIVRSMSEDVAVPRRDPTYIPPCLTVTGSPMLRELVRDLTSQIVASRNELVLQINRGEFSIDNLRGVQLEQLLRLRTLNNYSAYLDSLVRTVRSVTPFEMYLKLRELLGELAALRPDNDQYQVVDYDHDDPAIAFNELSNKIRPLLRGTYDKSKVMVIPFTMNREGKFFEAILTDEALSLPNEYFLAVKTKMDRKELAELVQDADRFKLMPSSMVTHMVFGVRLQYESYPPVQLPAQIGMYYFRLNRSESSRIWERIKREKAMAARWPGVESTDFDMKLYMTVPAMEAKK